MGKTIFVTSGEVYVSNNLLLAVSLLHYSQLGQPAFQETWTA